MAIQFDPRCHRDDARSRYGSSMQRVVLQLLRPGDTFCDVGARIGFFSVGAARLVGESGSVVALEPDRDSFWRLVHNVGLNGLVHVKTLNFAAQRSPGNRDLIRCIAPGSQDRAGASAVLPVQAGRLDDVLIRPPDLIKVDVGGSEVEVLAGAGALLRRHGSIWLIEAHGAGRLSEVVALLSSFGYAPCVVAEEACPAGRDRYFVVAHP
jgi:FkbM family methyltransferase